MKLKIKNYIAKTFITTTDNEVVYTIKNRSLFDQEKIIYNSDNEIIYTVRRDPKPLDRRAKYIFKENDTGNEFYAWVGCRPYKREGAALHRLFLFSPLEFYIEAESFFGEICIRRSGISKFSIFMNGKKEGSITNKSIECDTIDDPALLCVLVNLSKHISDSEDSIRMADAV